MRSRRLRSTFGRPAFFRDFQRQNALNPGPVPAEDRLWLNHLRRAKQARPQPGHQYQQRPVTATQPKAGGARLRAIPSWWRRNKFSASSRRRDLNRSMRSIPSECRTASIGPNHAMILPPAANPHRMEFSEGTGAAKETYANAGRGRDASCLAPPAQTRTCSFPAYGSHLGY